MIILLPFPASSQFIQSIDSKTIDSLELLLPGSEGDARVDLLNELAELYAWYDPEKAEIYSNEALESSVQTAYLVGEGAALYGIGYRKHLAGDPVGASVCFRQAIDIIEQTTNYHLLAKIYLHFSSVLFQDGNEIEKAIEYAPKILALYQMAGARKDEAIGYLILSGSYHRLNQPEKAIEYLNKFRELSKELGISDLRLINGLTLAGQCYFNMGKVDTAMIIIKKTIAQYNTNVFEEISLKSQTESLLGYYYLRINETDSASRYLYQSLKTSKSNGNAYCEMKANYTLAYMFYLQSDFERCISYCNPAINISYYIDSTGTYYFNDSLKHSIAISEDIFFPISKSRRRYYAWTYSYACYSMLWDSYLAIGEKEKAIKIHQSWMAIRDSISIYKTNKSILELNISYETEKKEQEMARLEEDNLLKETQLKQSNWIVGGLVFVVFMIVFMAIILIRQNKLRNDQRTLVLQQRLFRLQMKPHFLYNSLASIQNFIIHKNPSEASSYLSKFSKLVRQILNSSATEYIALDEELDSIENYLALQKIRYRDMFDYCIDKDEAIDTETTSIPPMLAQPFIENSIEHGIKNKDSKGFVSINIKQKKDYFILAIEDNGVGRSKAKELEKVERKDHKSMATPITIDRLDALNKKLKQKIRFDIIDLKDENGIATGTKVIFDIPLSL